MLRRLHIRVTLAGVGSEGGRSVMKEMNVIGTMQLLATCQKSTQHRVRGRVPGIRRCSPSGTKPKDLSASDYAKDAVEMESYLRGFVGAVM